MSPYYGRAGESMTRDEWVAALEDGNRVALDDVNGNKVSTVWIGIDHRFGDGGAPLIFETMVFAKDPDPSIDEDCWRWSTEANALAGHMAVVAWLLNEGPRP